MSTASEISLSDEASLSWYFGLGLSIYDRSTFGAIVRKLNAEAFGSETCARCDGAGILDTGGFSTDDRCKTCDGVGKIADGKVWCHDCKGFGCVAAYEKPADHGGWCPACRGTGSTPVEGVARRRNPCSSCGGDQWAKRRCSHCLATGEEPITAKPMQKPQEAVGVEADSGALTRFAITSRRVAKVRAQSPALAEALGVYYGDMGQAWARTDRGRLFALYHLTGAGRRLARWGEKSGADLGLSVQERLGAQAALEASQPRQERGALLMAAGKQAAELYGRAAQAWNDQALSRRDRKAFERLTESLSRLGHAELSLALERHVKASQ
jgi:hypothetical protein